jgi:hypothetical protein
MARDILDDFGPDSSGAQKGRAKTGGVKQAEDVMNYKMPQGPTSVNNPQTPGLHGNVYPSGSQTASTQGGEGGSPGIGGKSPSKSGSQR